MRAHACPSRVALALALAGAPLARPCPCVSPRAAAPRGTDRLSARSATPLLLHHAPPHSNITQRVTRSVTRLALCNLSLIHI
eukprot:717187-Prymnesium_polylepis.1